MTIEDFSNGFDVLLNSYALRALNGEPSSYSTITLDEYEKSVFLTLAQDEIVKNLYQDAYGIESFERDEKIRRQLEPLVEQKEYTSESDVDLKLEDPKYNHYVYELQDNLWFIVYEQLSWDADEGSCLKGMIADVVPCTHDDYWRVRNNPFRGPTNKRALRLDNKGECVELVTLPVPYKYTVRYLRKPKPIILENLDRRVESLNIDGYTDAMGCELQDSLHLDILDRAVRLALASRITLRDTKDKS